MKGVENMQEQKEQFDFEKMNEISAYRKQYISCPLYCIEEILYKRTPGEYFLYRYSEVKGVHGRIKNINGEIIPLSKKDAKKWMKEKGSEDEYTGEFGEKGEGDG